MSVFEFNQELYDQALREDARADGKLLKLISQVCKKIRKNQSLEEIAEDLEEEVSVIRPIYDAVKVAAPEDDIDAILHKV